MQPSTPCPFCNLAPPRIIAANEHALAIRDAYPISPGHSLIIARRHVGSFFELSESERMGVLTLLGEIKSRLDSELAPAAYNVGFNDGAAAGQTVPHMHVHVIPRYAGDTADPRGGIRWVLPDRARYWA